MRSSHPPIKTARYFLGRQKQRAKECARRLMKETLLPSLPNDSLARLMALRGKYFQHDCVIVGNGPSLNDMDLSVLRGKYCFFFNGAFDLRDYTDPDKRIHVCEDRLVFEDHQRALNEIGGLKFFPSDLLHLVDCDDAIILEFHRGYPEKSPDWPKFVDCQSRLPIFYWGGTVAYLALQIAQWMGFRRIYIIGVDLSYSIPDTVIENGLMLESTGDDPNHYRPTYFGGGLRWHVPMPKRMKRAFTAASKKSINRNVYNAGVGGNLDCFPRVSAEALASPAELSVASESLEQ